MTARSYHRTDTNTSLYNQVRADRGRGLSRRVSIPSRGTYRYAELSNIVYLEADSNYTRLHLADGRSLYTSKTLKYWQELINSPSFLRIHSKYVVNTQYITEVDTKTSRLLIGSTSLIISRSRKASVIKQMDLLTSLSRNY
jgi:two-component system LytT family response regulator